MTPIIAYIEGLSIVVQSREHLPPHLHAFYGDDEALVDIRSGEVLEGHLPIKKVKVLRDWLAEGDNRSKIETKFTN
jgi:hypothetical protein